MTETTTVRRNDVFEYRPDGGQHHCREGVAIAVEDHDGRIVLQDTFWRTTRDYDAHLLSDTEQATLRLLGNTDDFQVTTRHALRDYAAADRLIVPGQHNLQNTYYVRVGAQPDRATIIANAEAEVQQAERELRAAERHLESRRAELARLAAAV